MKNTFSKLTLAASFALAMAFTFSCSSNDSDPNSPVVSSSSDQISSDQSSSSIWEEVTQSSSSAKFTPTIREDGLCVIGNTIVTEYDGTIEGINPVPGEVLTDNCESRGTDNRQYLTIPAEDRITDNPEYYKESRLCDEYGVFVRRNTKDMNFWQIKASEELCEQFKNEGRIQE